MSFDFPYGVARAEEVDPKVWDIFERWLAEGRNGSMAYMERHKDIRRDPRLLLDGARTIISFAFPYRPPLGTHHPCIAD